MTRSTEHVEVLLEVFGPDRQAPWIDARTGDAVIHEDHRLRCDTAYPPADRVEETSHVTPRVWSPAPRRSPGTRGRAHRGRACRAPRRRAPGEMPSPQRRFRSPRP